MAEYHRFTLPPEKRWQSVFKSRRNVTKKITAAKSNVERVNLALQHMIIHNDYYGDFIPDKKDDEKASRAEQVGDAYFTEDEYMKALHSYNEALGFAESATAKSHAHAKRSKLLFYLAFYRECIIECNRAIKHGYPQNLRESLIERKELAIERRSQAEFMHHEEVPVIPKNRRNPLIMNASDSIKIRTDEENHRRVVATKEIAIGEVLVVEEAYTISSNKDANNHCHHCMKLCYNLIPCDGCTWMFFCSENCKGIANNAYHVYECRIGHTLKKSGLHGSGLLGLRMILQGFYKVLETNEPISEERTYYSNRLEDLLRLDCDLDELNTDQHFDLCFDVALMYHLVKNHTRFLERTDQHDKFKDLLLVAHTVARFKNFVLWTKKPHGYFKIAEGMFPTISLFNNECGFNAEPTCYGKTIVLRALRTIRKNEEIFVHNGYVFPTHSKEIRQSLSRCTCRVCEEDWPLLDELPKGILDYPKCKILRQFFEKCVDVVFANKVIPRLKNILKYMETPPSKIPDQCQTALRLSLLAIYQTLGNKQIF